MKDITTGGRKLMVVFPGDYDSAKKKGVEGQLLQFDENGFFDKVLFVGACIRRDARMVLDAHHEVVEVGFGRSFVQRLLAPLHVARLIAICARLVRREGIQLIRATEPTLCGFIAWAAAGLAGIPYCVSLHADYDRLYALDGRRGAPTLLGSRALIRPLERLTMGGAARVMPIRDSLIPYLLARGVGPDNIRVIPHGIDLTPFTLPPAVDIREMFGIPPGTAILAFAGRLSPENYVNEMLDAVRHVACQRDDFVLVLAGGGPLEAEITTRLAADPVLARVVRPVGFVSQETVRALRGVCRVSLCLMGGFSLIEACAAGRPVIAYDVDWHHELVVDGVTGRLVPEHQIEGVANAIGEFLDDEQKAQQMGAAGRALAFARHDIHVASENRRRCYAELLHV